MVMDKPEANKEAEGRMDKLQLLIELRKVMAEYEYRLYPRDWVIVLAGMAWDRMKEAEC